MRTAFSVALLGALIVFGSAAIAHAHDAFYPHHLQDLGLIRSREEVRVTVVISTAIFLLVLSGVIVLAIWRGRNEVADLKRDHRERLKAGIVAATDAAIPLWPTEPALALEAAFRAYASATNVRWNPALLTHYEMPIRCQLGGDVLSIRAHPDTHKILLQASYRDITVRGFLTDSGEIQYEG